MWGRRADAGDQVSPSAEEVPAFRKDGDPAQALLNVLSRFQRHYLRGREGAEQSAWSDDCMNALIDAVDVAVAQRWQEVVSVLTDTARVLQTYEDADLANDCVPFLTSSHEILCHMVGDLLTGQTRPGLLRKWDSLYERARDEIDAAGLSLVQDEVSDQELAYEAFGLEPQNDSPFEEPSAELGIEMDTPQPRHHTNTPRWEAEIPESEPETVMPFELPEISEVQTADPFDAVSLDDLPDLSDQEAAIPTMENTPEIEPTLEAPEKDEDFEPRILSFPGRPVDLGLIFEPDPVEGEDDYEISEEGPGEVGAENAQAMSGDGIAETQPADPEPSVEDEISGILDAACEALSNVTDGFDAFEVQVRQLEARADDADWEGASAACRSMLRLLEMLEARDIEPTDRFLELAYGFSGVYVESRDSVFTDEYRTFQKDCIALLQDWMDDRVEGVETADVVSEPVTQVAESEPLMSDSDATDPVFANLLNTVRAAMQGGRTANAKLLMLEAAASIAHEQEAEAAKLVGEAERALSENARALEEARNSVQDHENRVSETAVKVSEVQHGQEDHRRQAALLTEKLDETRGRVDSLDEQIRELQNRRAAAEADRIAAEEELNEALEREKEHEGQLELVRVHEREARLRLEEERGRAKALQNSRGDLERAVIAKRELLARQRQSTHDIERTIAHARESEAGDSIEEHDSLF